MFEDSSAYQLILDEGRVLGHREMLHEQGTARFGPPDPVTSAALNAIADLDRLHRMSLALLRVTTWAELLATP
jgi:hypothetical protein